MSVALAWGLAAMGFAVALASAYELRRRREFVARACHELRSR